MGCYGLSTSAKMARTLTGLKVLSTTHRLGTQRTASCGGGASVVVAIMPKDTNTELGGTGRQTYSALSPDDCRNTNTIQSMVVRLTWHAAVGMRQREKETPNSTAEPVPFAAGSCA